MSIQTIEKNLTEALLNDGAMRRELYEWEVEEHLDYFKESMRNDNDEFLFVVTEHTNDVAMLLIERTGEVHINEEAREKLKAIWPDTYRENMIFLIPSFAEQLHNGELAVNGVKVAREYETEIDNSLN